MKRLWPILTAPVRAVWALARALVRILLTPFRWWQRFRQTIHHFLNDIPEEEPLAETFARPQQGAEAFWEFVGGIGFHLQALRAHLLRAVIALALTTALSFYFAEPLMQALAMPLGHDAQTRLTALLGQPAPRLVAEFFALGAEGIARMQVIEPTESIGVFMRVALLSGLALAMPWIVFELYLFIAPGLMPPTRKALLGIIPLASALFLTGLAFTYFVMLPPAISFLYTFGNFQVAWRPAKYFEIVTGLMFWIGVAFQMPLVIYTLAALGWIKTQLLIDQWRIAIIAIAVIAAMVTPTVDPVNMGLVMLPMILLYGLSILAAKVAETNRARAARPNT